MKYKKIYIITILCFMFLFFTNITFVNAFWARVGSPNVENDNQTIEIGSGKKIKTRIRLEDLNAMQNVILLPKNYTSFEGVIETFPKPTVKEITFSKKVIWEESILPATGDDGFYGRLDVSVTFDLKNKNNLKMPLSHITPFFNCVILNNNNPIKANDLNGVDICFIFSYNIIDSEQDPTNAQKLLDSLFLNDIILNITYEVVLS